MCAAELPVHDAPAGPAERAPARAAYGTIVVVGGGCYGSYYVRQLGRARAAGKLGYRRLLVVDRDPACRVATELRAGSTASAAAVVGAPEVVVDVVVDDWTAFFDRYLALAVMDGARAAHDAIVPSPLMPHLLYQWLARRAAERWPHRTVATIPLDRAPGTPWERAAPDGTHYVSFATWTCPVNCIEPAKCPATRGPREWSMPVALAAYAADERARGAPVAGPVVFHCSHRAYGVGMIDTGDVVAADRLVCEAGEAGPARVLVGTVSHCHGAVNLLTVGAAPAGQP